MNSSNQIPTSLDGFDDTCIKHCYPDLNYEPR